MSDVELQRQLQEMTSFPADTAILREVLASGRRFWSTVKEEQDAASPSVRAAMEQGTGDYGAVFDGFRDVMARSIHPKIIEHMVELFVAAIRHLDEYPELVTGSPALYPTTPESRPDVEVIDTRARAGDHDRLCDVEDRLARLETLILGEGAMKYETLRGIRSDVD